MDVDKKTDWAEEAEKEPNLQNITFRTKKRKADELSQANVSVMDTPSTPQVPVEGNDFSEDNDIDVINESVHSTEKFINGNIKQFNYFITSVLYFLIETDSEASNVFPVLKAVVDDQNLALLSLYKYIVQISIHIYKM